MKLVEQCSEKGFELEIKSADNRILHEQLENKCTEIKELQEKISHLERQLLSLSGAKMSSPTDDCVSDELKKKMQSQEVENEKLKLERVQILEENSGLRVQNQKLSDEGSYAKELASAAAIELKNLAGEITKLSLQNTKLDKELHTSRELTSRSHKLNDVQKAVCTDRVSSRSNDEFDSWSLDLDDLKLELQARKQREATLEAALAGKEVLEAEYRKKVEDAKKREIALENDLANMWVLVTQLKKEENNVTQEHKINYMQNLDKDQYNGLIDCEKSPYNLTSASTIPFPWKKRWSSA